MVEFFELLGVAAFVWIVLISVFLIYIWICEIKEKLFDVHQSYQNGYEIGYISGWSDCNEGKRIDKETEQT